ncbi:hypothetical protein [Neptuniibacter sp. QD34_54]|uniref:hypothetical protein n=1 Tax=Neptuniibacter sp. QD34_54 TaxID=3398208 RepID=UPI0039F474EB
MSNSDHTDVDKVDDTNQEKRKRIGLLDTEPRNSRIKPEGLTAQQQALREAAINQFKSNKIKAFIAKQVKHINSNRQVADGIRFLFDEHGLPPANAPLEDIISERKKIESEIRWFEAMCSELRNKLGQVKEIEELAMEMLENQPK